MVMNMEYMQMVISRLLASLPLYCFPASRLLSAIELSTSSATLSVAVTHLGY